MVLLTLFNSKTLLWKPKIKTDNILLYIRWQNHLLPQISSKMHFVLCGEQGSDFTSCEDVTILALAQKYTDQLEWDHREYIEFEIGFNMFAMNISSSYINKNFEVVSVENTSMAIFPGNFNGKVICRQTIS